MKQEAILIDQYIAAKGVRRFDQGVSASYESVQRFLLARGYDMRRVQSTYAMKKAGKPGLGKRMAWHKVVVLVDELRIAEGLEPLAAAHKLAA
ncbi:hypothetical protein F9L00_12715 [Brucella anthropi]|uniref:hypothetical protein n=1 Tax=Brucella/Ochrobactrum group TaxID=2826938 RepID=UPI00124D5713|nr:MULTISPECIES: hypothetical protein [Brucella/Ochrobactrum group]KAB2761726.1 hypothetical protein F9K98_15520 [Brucella anthropi]KAB2777584.1 hypothetical protein F9L00_12715 [Brucella anthropi]MCQ9145126.1 hypothetical protein [Ochrobactrum sp. BTU2]UGQ23252.1 hypothetical protein LRL11_22430 [Brucella anthropi]